MSKSQALRVLVNARLTAAAEEIFALFERTIAEYEEELYRSEQENQRKQRLLDATLNPRVLLPRIGAVFHVPSPSPPGLNLEITETPQIKEEPEEQSVKQEEDQPVFVPESSAACVKTDETSMLQQRHTEHREETQEEDISSEPHFHSATEGQIDHSSVSDNDDHYPLSCYTYRDVCSLNTTTSAETETSQKCSSAFNELLNVPKPAETEMSQNCPSALKEMSHNTCEDSVNTHNEHNDDITDADGSSSDGSCHSNEFEVMDDHQLLLKQMSKTNVVLCSVDTPTGSKDSRCHDGKAQNSSNSSSYHGTVMSSATVTPIPATGSKYTKRQYCLFCKKPISKLSKHLERLHRKEKDVAMALSFDKGSKERREMLHRLTKRGNFSHNATVATSGVGQLVACRRPGAAHSPDDFVHCKLCQGLYLRKGLWRHVTRTHKKSIQGVSRKERKRLYIL